MAKVSRKNKLLVCVVLVKMIERNISPIHSNFYLVSGHIKIQNFIQIINFKAVFHKIKYTNCDIEKHIIILLFL